MKTIAVDFDGVIHRYSRGWQDGRIYDEPVEGALEALAKLVANGYKVVIFTTRARDAAQIQAINDWLLERMPNWDSFESIEVTDRKPGAIAYIDDRAIRFTNWTDILRYYT